MQGTFKATISTHSKIVGSMRSTYEKVRNDALQRGKKRHAQRSHPAD